MKLTKRLLPLCALGLASVALGQTYKTYDFAYSNSSQNKSGFAHGTAYTWGLTGDQYTGLWTAVNSGNTTVTGATLTFKGLYNDTRDSYDVLFVNVLDHLQAGNKSYQYQSGSSSGFGSNVFVDVPATNWDKNDKAQASLKFNDAQPGSLLVATEKVLVSGQLKSHGGTWSDPDDYSTKSDITITFSSANLALLQQLLDNDPDAGNYTVGIGFAAECHYYATSVSLSIATKTTTPPNKVPDGGHVLILLGLATSCLAAFRRFSKA